MLKSRNIQSNYIQILIDLTTSIRKLNRADAHPMIPTNLAHCFHTWGMRINRHPKIIGPVNLLEHVSTHRLILWRELKPKDLLHLNDHLRLKMGKSSVEYFKVIYKITECKAKSKNEAYSSKINLEKYTYLWYPSFQRKWCNEKSNLYNF